jgi:hypothetical protein
VGNARSWVRRKEDAPNWKVPCRRRVVARDSQSPVSDDGWRDPVVWSCRSNGCEHHGDVLACSHGMCLSLPLVDLMTAVGAPREEGVPTTNFFPLDLATGPAALSCPLRPAAQTSSARRASALRVRPSEREYRRPCLQHLRNSADGSCNEESSRRTCSAGSAPCLATYRAEERHCMGVSYPIRSHIC